MSESEIQKQLSIIIQSLGKIDNRLDSIEKTQVQHGEFLKKHTQILTNHNELLNQLVESQENQEYLLNALSVRSAKQDAEILKLQKIKRSAI